MNYTGNYTHEIHRGDIFMVDLGDVEGRDNSLFAKIRPCCCISNPQCNRHSPVLSFICLTSNTTPSKMKLPTRVFVGANETGMKDSTAACEQIISVPRNAVIRFVSRLSDETMQKIDNAIKIQLSL